MQAFYGAETQQKTKALQAKWMGQTLESDLKPL
jgi:hypothetical protein